MALSLTDKSLNGNSLVNSGITESLTNLPFTASTSSANLVAASSQYASIADASQTGLDFPTTFTAEFWLYLNQTPASANYSIVSKDQDGDPLTHSYYIWVASDGFLHIIANSGSNLYEQFRYNVTVPTASWHHWAITVDVSQPSATTFVFYLDGVNVGNGTQEHSDAIASIQDSTTPFAIGARYDPGTTPKDFCDGLLDEVRMWNTVRTASQISANRSIRLTGTETGLVGYWPMEVFHLHQSVGNSGLGLSSISATWGANTTSGNMVVVGAVVTNAVTLGTVTSITDTQGNTYSRAVTKAGTAIKVIDTELWYATNIVGGAGSVTVNNVLNAISIYAREYSGNYNLLDVTSSALGSSTTINSGTTATTTQGNELVVVATGDETGGTQTYQSAGAFSNMIGTTTTATGLSMSDKLVNVAGAQTGTQTMTVGDEWISVTATFGRKINPRYTSQGMGGI